MSSPIERRLQLIAQLDLTTADIAAALVTKIGPSAKAFDAHFIEMLYTLYIVCRVSPQKLDDFTMTKAVEFTRALERSPDGIKN